MHLLLYFSIYCKYQPCIITAKVTVKMIVSMRWGNAVWYHSCYWCHPHWQFMHSVKDAVEANQWLNPWAKMTSTRACPIPTATHVNDFSECFPVRMSLPAGTNKDKTLLRGEERLLLCLQRFPPHARRLFIYFFFLIENGQKRSRSLCPCKTRFIHKLWQKYVITVAVW